MKRLSFIALLLLISVLVLSAGCFSSSTTNNTPKAPVGVWYLDGGNSGELTFNIFEDGTGICVFEFDNGVMSANQYDLDVLGFAGYVKKSESEFYWEQIYSNQYGLTLEGMKIEMYNGQSEYYPAYNYDLNMGIITVYDENTISWDIDELDTKYTMERK